MSSAPKTLEVPGYQVMEFLGSGARSTIWRVRDVRNGKYCALKRVIKRQSSDSRFLEQAINEYNVASSLDHDVIRRVHRLRRVKHWLSLREIHLLMEFCEGKTLQERRPKAVRHVVGIYAQVADGLVHMNTRGYVHADTKPNNILVASDGTVKLIDLGQSCPLGAVKQRIQGTPDFIAPEQVRRNPLDARTDVFNFGAAMYWTLTGKAIPTALPKTNGVALKADMAIVPPEQINPEVTLPISKLIRDCIEPLPSRRPASMKEVSSRLALVAHTLNKAAEQQ